MFAKQEDFKILDGIPDALQAVRCDQPRQHSDQGSQVPGRHCCARSGMHLCTVMRVLTVFSVLALASD